MKKLEANLLYTLFDVMLDIYPMKACFLNNKNIFVRSFYFLSRAASLRLTLTPLVRTFSSRTFA